MGESTGEKGEPQLVIRGAFADFGNLQLALESLGITPLSAEHEYICTVPTELPEEQATEVLTVIDKLEQDELLILRESDILAIVENNGK